MHNLVKCFLGRGIRAQQTPVLKKALTRMFCVLIRSCLEMGSECNHRQAETVRKLGTPSSGS